MTRLFKILALWLIVGTMVWLFTLWHWQQTHRDVGLFDIVTYLFVLPTAIVMTWVVALWGVKRVRAKAGEPIAVPTAQANGAKAGDVQAHSDEALRQAHAWVLDAALHCRAGLDPVSAWNKLKAGSIRPDLDAQLQDLDGLPIFSARVPELEVDDALGDDAGDAAPPMAVSRALALLDAPCSRLAETWQGLLDVLSGQGGPSPVSQDLSDAQATSPSYLSGVGHRPASSAADLMPAVRWSVRLLIPATWSVADQDLVVCQLRSRLSEVVEQAQACGLAAPQWQVIPPATPEAWWREWDEQIQRWTREALPEAMLILAVDSALDDDSVARWQAIGELFTAQHQIGRVPGEAAVGLLVVSDALQGRLADASLPQRPVRVSRPVHLLRDKSADAVGRVGATTLAAAMTQALLAAGVVPSQDLMVVADADHRASRATELFEALQAVVPGLDPLQNVARAGEALGDVGVARSLLSAALGCAAVWASDGEQVALAAHVQSPHARVVLALSAADAARAVPV